METEPEQIRARQQSSSMRFQIREMHAMDYDSQTTSNLQEKLKRVLRSPLRAQLQWNDQHCLVEKLEKDKLKQRASMALNSDNLILFREQVNEIFRQTDDQNQPAWISRKKGAENPGNRQSGNNSDKDYCNAGFTGSAGGSFRDGGGQDGNEQTISDFWKDNTRHYQLGNHHVVCELPTPNPKNSKKSRNKEDKANLKKSTHSKPANKEMQNQPLTNQLLTNTQAINNVLNSRDTVSDQIIAKFDKCEISPTKLGRSANELSGGGCSMGKTGVSQGKHKNPKSPNSAFKHRSSHEDNRAVVEELVGDNQIGNQSILKSTDSSEDHHHGDAALSVPLKQLLELSPANALTWSLTSSNRPSSTLSITNNSRNIVAFKIRANFPTKYTVVHRVGLIQPFATETIKLLLKNGHEFHKSHKFMIMACIVNSDITSVNSISDEVWTKVYKEEMTSDTFKHIVLAEAQLVAGSNDRSITSRAAVSTESTEKGLAENRSMKSVCSSNKRSSTEAVARTNNKHDVKENESGVMVYPTIVKKPSVQECVKNWPPVNKMNSPNFDINMSQLIEHLPCCPYQQQHSPGTEGRNSSQDILDEQHIDGSQAMQVSTPCDMVADQSSPRTVVITYEPTYMGWGSRYLLTLVIFLFLFMVVYAGLYHPEWFPQTIRSVPEPPTYWQIISEYFMNSLEIIWNDLFEV